MFGIFRAIESDSKRLQMGAVAGAGMGLALLSKGPVGVALPLLFALIYLTLSRSWPRAPLGASSGGWGRCCRCRDWFRRPSAAWAVREAAALALLRGFPVAGGRVVAWSLLWQATVWLASLPGILFVRQD